MRPERAGITLAVDVSSVTNALQVAVPEPGGQGLAGDPGRTQVFPAGPVCWILNTSELGYIEYPAQAIVQLHLI